MILIDFNFDLRVQVIGKLCIDSHQYSIENHMKLNSLAEHDSKTSISIKAKLYFAATNLHGSINNTIGNLFL